MKVKKYHGSKPTQFSIGRDSPGQYRELSSDTRQLANILQGLEDVVRNGRLQPEKLDELLEQGQEVRNLLLEMEQMLHKYAGLSVKSKVAIDRWAWDNEAAESLRKRLNAKVNILNSVYLTIIASGQFKLQQAMDQIVQDLKSGQR